MFTQRHSRLKSLFIISPLIIASQFTYACDGSLTSPCVVKDTQNQQVLIKNYRDNLMIKDSYKGNNFGLNQFWASGSGVLNERSWQALFLKLSKKAADNNLNAIIIIDLRQESHGYLNGEAINLTTHNNWANVGKTYQQSLLFEKNWLKKLSQMKILKDVISPANFKKNNFEQGETLTIESIKSEKHTVQDIGFKYLRLTVTDHRKPSNADVERFVSIVKSYANHSWLHLHCRGGKGRTTTFLVMLDMLYNAHQLSFDEILERNASVEPFYDLSQTQRKNRDLSPYYQQRYDFLKKFYQYSKFRKINEQISWVQWLQSNPH